MATASISSNTGPLDVQGLVSQLMTVAQQPLNRLQSQAKSYNSQISNLGVLNSDLTALQSAVSPLATGQFAQAYSATSSNTTVLGAVASTSANTGTYNITVSSLASSQNLALAGQASETASLGNAADSMTFNFADGSNASVSIAANASLDQISNAINSAAIGVSATVVKADNSAAPYRLVLTGTSVGAGKGFDTSAASGQSSLSFLGFDLSSAVDGTGNITDSRLTAQAQDASLTVNGLSMTASSNSVTSAINGLTLNLTQAGSSTVTVATDLNSIQSKIQGFVDAYNKVSNDAQTLHKGVLQGDYTMVSLQNQLFNVLNTPISGANGTTTVAYLAQAGISLQKDGTLKLDSTALSQALSNNRQAVINLFGNDNGDGYATRFNDLINNFLGPNGLITSRTSGIQSQVNTLSRDIDQENTRLGMIQSGYLSLYTKLNNSLMQMQSTSTSLTNMLAALPGSVAKTK